MRRGSFEVPLSGEFDLSFLDDIDLPPTIGRRLISGNYVECGLIECATFLAREEGR